MKLGITLGVTWAVRIAMFLAIASQKSKVVDIYYDYLRQVADVESAVQASQLSGEGVLLSIVWFAKLIFVIVLWAMVELTLKEIFKIFNRKKKPDGFFDLTTQHVIKNKGDVVHESN